MYKALKSAQNEIQEALLKFVDEAASSKTAETRCPRGEPCQCALTQSSVRSPVPLSSSSVPGCSPNQYDSRFEDIQNNLQFLHQKQNVQYEALMTSIQMMNTNITKILSQLSAQTVETATTIPNLQPTAQGSDLKNVCVEVSHVGVLPNVEPPQTLETPSDLDDDQSAIEGDITPDIEEEEVAEEEVAEELAEDEEGVEVEEWTYKGRKFFKDSENTVYANTNGELGDPIGLYDPVKNIVKKLPTSS